jgi:hypothetical protein
MRRVIYCLFVVAGFTTTPFHPVRAAQDPAGSCLDESGALFTKGGLRRVGKQIQQCDGEGTWVAGSASSTPAQHLAGAFCKAEKNQSYENGLLRKVGAAFEKCDNGKWTKVAPEPVAPKACVDPSGKRYPSGATRSVAGKVQSCDDGKWVSKIKN